MRTGLFLGVHASGCLESLPNKLLEETLLASIYSGYWHYSWDDFEIRSIPFLFHFC
jgi:hypothetical protein